MEEFIGAIKLLAFNFTPPGFMPCDGTLLPIAQYTPLFALLGTTYGGDGVKNFALPNLGKSSPVPGLHYVIAFEGLFPSRP